MQRHGVRSSWEAMPESVRCAVDQIAGSAVTTATNLDGGFSPGPAARCALADGRTVFVKAVGLDHNPHSPGMHRREAQALRSFGASVPAPRLIGVFDDGDWVALVIEWVQGRMPIAPLAPPDVARLLRLVERLSHIGAGADLLPCADAHAGISGHWRELVDQQLDGLDEWSIRHLEALAGLEADVADAMRGDRLVHFDLRSDNVLFADAGEAHDVIVDWPGASAGAPWVDLAGLLPALELDGGPSAHDTFEQHPLGKVADPDAVNTFVAAMAGYFTRSSLLPAPPGLPTLRQFQAAQGVIARRWLARRLGWDMRTC